MKAKKSYGQHFLNQESIAQRIADSLSAQSENDSVLEIGPGQGMLTKYLIEKPYHFMAVDADKDMIDYLKNAYPEISGQIVYDDVLRVRFEQHFDDQFYVIGNFPYNISSQILFKIIKYRDRVPEMVGMFQKEVAERVVAKEGSRTYGVISVLIQAFYKGEYLFGVDKSCFTPPPKVQSAVIKLVRKSEDLEVDYKHLRMIVKTAFNQRRKMLRNNLKTLFTGHPILQSELFTKRPEHISVEQFIELTKIWENEISK